MHALSCKVTEFCFSVQATSSVEDPNLLLKRAKALFVTAQCHMNWEEEGHLKIAKASLLEACQISPRDSTIRGAWNTLRSKIESKSQSKPKREQEWTQQCDTFGMERLPEKRCVISFFFVVLFPLFSYCSHFTQLCVIYSLPGHPHDVQDERWIYEQDD
jgi:hypothetical protein